MTDKDPYIGETYQDKDWRSNYRRIKITGFDVERGKYIGELVGETTGFAKRKGHYKKETLDKRYKKVSH